MSDDQHVMSTSEINSTLQIIFSKIKTSQSKEIGYELYKKLISKNITDNTKTTYIIKIVKEYLNSLLAPEKEYFLPLLSLLFHPDSQPKSDYINTLDFLYSYSSPIISIIQSLIIESNSSLFSSIASIYAEIVQYLMPNDISASDKKLDPEEKKAYEILQNFCLFNLKKEQGINRVVGSLCLTKLVENCPFVLKNQYMKLIFDTIISCIDNKDFNAKYELLNCLISLILGAENLFCPYANVTLYKVLDFLSDTDWLKRKLALNVIYTLIFYCKKEILPLQEQIINFLNVLKNDNVKEIRDVSVLILKIFDDKEKKPIKNNNNNSNRVPKKTSEIPKTKITTNKIYNNKNKIQKKFNIVPRIKNNTSSSKVKNSTRIGTEKQLVNKLKNDLINEGSDIKSKQYVTKRNNSGIRRQQLQSKSKPILTNEKNNNEQKNTIEKNKSILSKASQDNFSSGGEFSKHPKYVNRDKNLSFINKKMVIKQDPNRSIFKTGKNQAFFEVQNQNNNNDIIIMTKDNKPSYRRMNDVKNNNNITQNYKTVNEKIKYDFHDNNKENESSDKFRSSNKKTKHNDKSSNKNKSNSNLNNSALSVSTNNNQNTCTCGCCNINPTMVNNLLNEMKSLSNKQISLIDAMENIQHNTQQQIEILNKKIINLESEVSDLNQQLFNLEKE